MQEIRIQLGSYCGAIERWKMVLALKRMAGLGFPRHEWGQLLQELALDIWLFRYDSNGRNGASESTALFALITNRLMGAMRNRRREQDVMVRLESVLIEQDEELDPDPALVYEDNEPIRIDVRQAVASLPPRERAVCEGLRHGETIHEIAQRLRCSWHAVKSAIARIRSRFENIGLDGYVAERQRRTGT